MYVNLDIFNFSPESPQSLSLPTDSAVGVGSCDMGWVVILQWSSLKPLINFSDSDLKKKLSNKAVQKLKALKITGLKVTSDSLVEN